MVFAPIQECRLVGRSSGGSLCAGYDSVGQIERIPGRQTNPPNGAHLSIASRGVSRTLRAGEFVARVFGAKSTSPGQGMKWRILQFLDRDIGFLLNLAT